MDLVTIADIKKAKKRLKKHLQKTPLNHSYYLSSKFDLDIFLKMENLNLSGSFKIRGATNALLSADQALVKKNGVATASAGNHAQGLARIANLLGVKATIFMPKQAPLVKIETTKNLGATVILEGNTYDETEMAAKIWNEKNQAFWIHPFSDPAVIAGQGTVGLEILDDLSDVGAVVIPIGGGGLVSGISTAIKSKNEKIKIFGVQAELYNSLSMRYNNQTEETNIQRGQSIADGIAVKSVNDYTYSHIEKYVDKIVSVNEDEIAAAIMELMERDHILAEGAGAATIAGLNKMYEEIKELVPNKKIVSIISGGNIDVSLLNRITKKGLLYSGRIMRLKISMSDKPGELVNLLSIISETGANLYNIEHNRVFSSYGVQNVDVDIDLETINKDHQIEIRNSLHQSGFQIR